MFEELQGQIERVTFHIDETGFTIARLKVKGFRELVTAIGNLMAPLPEQVLHATGEWTTHPRFGEQFKIIRYQPENHSARFSGSRHAEVFENRNVRVWSSGCLYVVFLGRESPVE